MNKPENWQNSNNIDQKRQLGNWLIFGNQNGFPNYTTRTTEYEGYDGWYNNLAKPDLGAIGHYK